MKITLAILGLAAAASAYPMFLLEEEPVYSPGARVARQIQLGPDAALRPPRRSNNDDLETAADTAYGGAPVSFVDQPALA